MCGRKGHREGLLSLGGRQGAASITGWQTGRGLYHKMGNRRHREGLIHWVGDRGTGSGLHHRVADREGPLSQDGKQEA